MEDRTEGIRREMVGEINSPEYTPEGQEWTTAELQKEFEVTGFLAPFVMARRKSDGVTGTLMFKHSPRIYFGWAAN